MGRWCSFGDDLKKDGSGATPVGLVTREWWHSGLASSDSVAGPAWRGRRKHLAVVASTERRRRRRGVAGVLGVTERCWTRRRVGGSAVAYPRGGGGATLRGASTMSQRHYSSDLGDLRGEEGQVRQQKAMEARVAWHTGATTARRDEEFIFGGGEVRRGRSRAHDRKRQMVVLGAGGEGWGEGEELR
jgi:hypothetical protein